MKYILIVFIFFVTSAFAVDFSGCWEYEGTSSSYKISLHEDNDKLSGTYCFINEGGNKIDCDKSASLIDGEINNGIGSVSFGGSGKGNLTYKNKYIILNIVDSKPFDDFNMHIPNKIKLSKGEACSNH